MDELLGPIRANWTRYLYAAAVLPLRVAWLPLSYLVAVLKALFAPAGYVLAYIGTWIVAIANFLVSLEPLYTFFSVAAFMGIVAGILMAVASAVLTSYLGMHEGPEDVAEQQRRALGHKKQAYLGQYLRRDPQGLEPDWHWADTASPARFRRASGLQTETIHEEEDSEE